MAPKDILHALDMLNSNGAAATKQKEPEIRMIDPKWMVYPKYVSFPFTVCTYCVNIR